MESQEREEYSLTRVAEMRWRDAYRADDVVFVGNLRISLSFRPNLEIKGLPKIQSLREPGKNDGMSYGYPTAFAWRDARYRLMLASRSALR